MKRNFLSAVGLKNHLGRYLWLGGLLLVILIASALEAIKSERFTAHAFPAIDIIASHEGTINYIGEPGSYVASPSILGAPVYTITSTEIDEFERTTREELVKLLGLLPVRYVRTAPQTWDIDLESDGRLARTKAILAEEVSRLGREHELLLELVKAPENILSKFESSILSKHVLGPITLSQIRQLLINATWEALIRRTVAAHAKDCGLDRYCASTRAIPLLLIPPLEQVYLDRNGRSQALNETPEIDICNDHVSAIEEISKSVVEGPMKPQSSFYEVLVRDKNIVNLMRSECSEVNAKLDQFSKLVVYVRKIGQAAPDDVMGLKEGLRVLLETNLRSKPTAARHAEQIISAYHIFRTQLKTVGPSKPILMQTLLASLRPTFEYDGRFFKVKERVPAVQFLGHGNIFVSDDTLLLEHSELGTLSSRFDSATAVADSLAAQLRSVDLDRLTALNDSSSRILDADNAADLMLSEANSFHKREAKRKEVYERISIAMVQIASERRSVLLKYSGGAQFASETSQIEAVWASPGQMVKREQKIASVIPTHRWKVSGKVGRWSKFSPDSARIVRLSREYSTPLADAVSEILSKSSAESRSIFISAVSEQASKLTYRLRTERIKSGLLAEHTKDG